MKNEIRKIEHVYGIEYVSEKKEKKKKVLFVLIILSLYYMYNLYAVYKKGYFVFNEFQIFLFVTYLSFIVVYSNNQCLEKLFLINNVGIQIEKKDLFQRQLKFICLNDVKSIFINEAIYIFEICPYLCIILKNNKFVVLFENFNLEMKSLVNIYRDMKRIVFYNDYKKLRGVKAVDIKEEKGENEEENNFVFLDDVAYAANIKSSSEEENIFKLLNFSSGENHKINDKSQELEKMKIYDIYINKKLALEIMNN
ncbi:phosphatidylinositol N-acetylglucosaminyltransferase subunit H, putative [Plasmodium malariae]|uniref:Phosphatidylinositol N-acetylglucosaminyltransferase subunit H, putative n=1 Tax=Plasmodium malariae TaxID=5858 RepID=A0A1C3KD77_PLAMA|nr:phosphatidylinositol N-acetylglucosaminyltransferase subunit H, putative [Plasmodium malariae]